jgi:preprotein translocase subunit SecA
LLAPSKGDARAIQRIHEMREELVRLNHSDLKAEASRTKDMLRFMAATVVVVSRVLGQDMFDVQLRGALALSRGNIAEMQTGEGKTLAAVPAIAWLARENTREHTREHNGVHVMTVNDYLARRDAAWMGGIYESLGLSVGYVQQGMTAEERRAAYFSDITYATANEIGFDFLRDQLALYPHEQVHRAFNAAVIDEADSILIDEARIPLVIAGADNQQTSLAVVAEAAVANLRPWHYSVDAGRHNVVLTDSGISAVEHALRCDNLFAEDKLPLHTAVQDALHAHVLLHRDVDYIVKNGAIELVDGLKGRVAIDRRWPPGLHSALEAKEGVAAKAQGRILGQITLQHLVALYPFACGMTGTAVTQELEFRSVYNMHVETIPTRLPVARVDEPDVLFHTREQKERTVAEEIRRAHASGQPVLVGTASVADSERLSARLADIPHEVLNARNDELEARIIARAGDRGAVTISTNMAGRGTDIRLGPDVADVGGLYVIGTNKHESRRIDNQLRGRSGRQGDPGRSRFFISLEDDLYTRYGELDERYRHDGETLQRLVEGQMLNQRIFLHGYEVPLEGQRHKWQTYRQQVLDGTVPCASETERLITLRGIDDLWSDYLARVADFRSGVHWLSWGGRDPHREFLRALDEWFPELEASLPGEVEQRMNDADAGIGPDPRDRGTVWTYLTTDQPFGTWTERIIRGLRRNARR